MAVAGVPSSCNVLGFRRLRGSCFCYWRMFNIPFEIRMNLHIIEHTEQELGGNESIRWTGKGTKVKV